MAQQEQEEVVIVDGKGIEHVFPAGFDPKRAAEIVRQQATDPPAPQPSTSGFLGNAASSAGNLVSGTMQGMETLFKDPVQGVKDVGSGIVNRVKAYGEDIHPVNAFNQLFMDDPNAQGVGAESFSRVNRAVGQALPATMLYEDPVGVAADLAGAKGAASGGRLAAKGVKRAVKGPPIETVVDSALRQTRKTSPTSLVSSHQPRPAAPPPTDAVSAPGRMGAWSPERGPLREPANPANRGGTLAGPAPSLEAAILDALEGTKTPDAPARVSAPPMPELPATASSVESLARQEAQGVSPVDRGATPAPAPVPPPALTQAPPVSTPAPSAPPPAARALPPANLEPTLDDLRSMLGAGETARDPRVRSLSQELGIPIGRSAVQDLTGTPSRQPGRASAAGMDLDFKRLLADERGSMVPGLMDELLMAALMKQLGLPAIARRGNALAGRVVPPALTAASTPRLAASHEQGR